MIINQFPVFLSILQNMTDVNDVLRLCKTNKRFAEFCRMPEIQKHINKLNRITCRINPEGFDLLEKLDLSLYTTDSKDLYMVQVELGGFVSVEEEELNIPFVICNEIKVDMINANPFIDSRFGQPVIHTVRIPASNGKFITVLDVVKAFIANNLEIHREVRTDQNLEDDEVPDLFDQVRLENVAEIGSGEFDMSNFTN